MNKKISLEDEEIVDYVVSRLYDQAVHPDVGVMDNQYTLLDKCYPTLKNSHKEKLAVLIVNKCCKLKIPGY